MVPSKFKVANEAVVIANIGAPIRARTHSIERKGATGSIGRRAPIIVPDGSLWACGCETKLCGFGGGNSRYWIPCGKHIVEARASG